MPILGTQYTRDKSRVHPTVGFQGHASAIAADVLAHKVIDELDLEGRDNWSRVRRRMDGAPSMMLGTSPLGSLPLLGTSDEGVIHRHLKPANVKVFRGPNLKPSSSHAFLEAGF